ncbi:MAG: hypothetical protein AAGG68_10105 [Bacteroidota bacterium]
MNKLCLLIFLPLFSIAQNPSYQQAYDYLKSMLEEENQVNFKKAVWVTENVYYEGSLDTTLLNQYVEELVALSKSLAKQNPLAAYNAKDEKLVNTWASIFSTMTDTIWVKYEGEVQPLQPFQYNFEDIFGQKDWSNMFVSSLLTKRKGNCHSMPYLYKIIAEELDVPCHIAIAPNHFYIKHRSEQMGWFNTELTSGSFPIDAWLMASGYISLQAVQNGIYMDTLSAKESIALCVIDLAHGYEHKYPDHDGSFVLQCCDLALQYFPDYVNALLLKAETYLLQLQQLQASFGYEYLKEAIKLPQGKTIWKEMNATYQKLYQLGYRQMPDKMYLEWLESLEKEKERYSNKKMSRQ